MAEKKRPEWVQKLAQRLRGTVCCQESLDEGLEWASQFKTFAAAWKALVDEEYLCAIIHLIDRKDCKYECGDDAKRQEFDRRRALKGHKGETYTAKFCRVFREVWPGVPPVFKKAKKKGKK